MTTTNTALLTRIELLEKEIAEIKKKLISDDSPPTASLRGVWSDIDVSEEDIDAAKKSLFGKLDDV
jgi:hypothetical protein